MIKRLRTTFKLFAYLFVAACVAGTALQPLSAQVVIPEGSTINSAVFWIYETSINNRPVTVHRITTEWAETVVTYNSFAESYAGAIEGGFTADAIGWKTVDITSLVQAWALGPLAGGYANYGIALVELVESGSNLSAAYRSSEYVFDPALRPKLVLTYTPPGGSPTTVTIQRPGSTAELVLDTYVSAIAPDTNYGTSPELATRHYGGLKKFSLVRFVFSFTPPSCPGTGTPGYWMNHPDDWPEDSIQIGDVTYDKYDAIALMQAAGAGDKTYTMFAALVAAKLNALLGCATVCPGGPDISATILAADAWMYLYPVGSGVAAGGPSSPWRTGEPLYFLLDQYNNGLLCVPHRD